MSKRAVLIAIGVGMGVAGFAGMALVASELIVHRQWSMKNSDAYALLHIGMGAEELIAARGTPDCTVQIRRSKALYYWGARFSFGGIPPCPSAVSQVSQLPRMYASLQVLLDENNRIAAVAFEGEAGLKAKDCKGAGKERLRQLDEQTVN